MEIFERAFIVVVAYTVSTAEFSNSAYTTSRPSGYIGCLKDSGHRILTKQLNSSGKNTGDNCKRRCQAEGYRYAGTQIGSQCFCGNCLHSYIEKSGCNDKCPGNRAEYCGGYWHLSIYDTWPCVLKPCTHGTNCVKVFDDSPNRYSCNCTADWTGGYCNKAVDECKNGPCLDGATCVDEIDGFRCKCGPNSTPRQCANETAHVTTNAVMCPSTLTTPPSTTAVSSTIKPPVITRPPSSTSRIKPSTSRIQPSTRKPQALTTRPSLFTTRPPPSTSILQPTTSRPQPSTARPQPSTTRDSSSTIGPSLSSATPLTSTTRASSFTIGSSLYSATPSTSTTRESSSSVGSSLSTATPLTSTTRASSSTIRSSLYSASPSTSTTRASSSTMGPSLSTATPLTSTMGTMGPSFDLQTYTINVYMDSLGNECPVLTIHGSESRIRLEYCNQANVFICSRIVNISDVIHDVEFIEMLKDMTVNVKQTYRAKRKLISTEDNRRSSTFIGGSGIIIMCAVFAFVMLADINWNTCKK